MINKISSVSFDKKNPVLNIQTKNQAPANIQYTPENVLKSLSVMAITNNSVVPFTGKSFEKTVEENYFKLPEGAQPDIFQRASAAYLYGGHDVLVTAPTGTGKTAIALYAITKNLEDGKKTFYTTPLKALSNEKFRNFQNLFGEENVGLITGDTKINKDAPIIVMTTEVYRNMIFGEKFKEHNPILDNLKTVVFDELHYLGDEDRGGVWEQSIILSDPKTQLLSLSATIGNNEDIARWMAKSRDLSYSAPQLSPDKIQPGRAESILRNAVKSENRTVGLINVPSEFRHVPLEFNNVIITASKNQISKHKNNQDKKTNKAEGTAINFRPPVPQNEDYQRMVLTLKKENKLPAIFFVFNKKGSKAILEHLTRFGEKLNTDEEVKQIDEIIDRYKSEGKYLGETLNKKALYKGYAIHNAGLLPTQKELIEELFQKKLVKVAIATETLSAGINMPARTTIISSSTKPTSDASAVDGRRELTPNEFHQMAGRAGRRGIDKKGYCYTMSLNPEQKVIFDNLIESDPNELKSAFRPDYSFVAGYYDTCQTDDFIKEIANKSFYTYDRNGDISEKKSKEFLKNFGTKRKVLRKFDYMDSAHNLSTKGKLLAKLNGYEQIPIIEAVVTQKFGGMNAVELATAVGTLANINLKYTPKHPVDLKKQKPQFTHQNSVVDYFVTKQENFLKKYNEDMAKIDDSFREVEIDTKVTNHIFDWAQLNTENENSVENWAKIMKGSKENPIRDEGSLFKEITMTVDLLKQFTEIAEEGLYLAENILEEKYYTELKHTANEAVKLISKEPVTA